MSPERIMQAGLVVALLGIVTGVFLIVIPGGALFLVGFVSWFYGRYLPQAVTATVALAKRRAFYGEYVSGTLHLVNDQPFPLPWLACSMEWPEELKLVDASQLVRQEAKLFFRSVHSMRGFERLNRYLSLQCLGRGEFTLGPMEVRVADPFGFAEGRRTVAAKTKILVYPRILPITMEPSLFNHPFGGKAIPSWLYEDPANFRGLRDYLPSDPFSRISWKATAKAGKLQTKIYDASFATEITVVLNTTTSKYVWELNPKLLERGIVVCASLVRRCYEAGYRFGIYANSSVGTGQSVAVRVGAGEAQLKRCLETMSRILPYQFGKCEQVLALAGKNTGENSRLYLVTAILTPEMVLSLDDLRRRGSRVAVILYSGQPADVADSKEIPVYAIAEKEEWNELEQITLVPFRR
ncbi:MAG TPA: DUF58 domain-containing protein [Firmicutes bacterium]|nr:DUF58 domain-containing protein [Bacillota bacterium]